MKAETNQQSKNKTTRKNNPVCAIADAKWYQDFVRHVELREFSPRTREAYLAWLRLAMARRPLAGMRVKGGVVSGSSAVRWRQLMECGARHRFG